MKIAIVEDDINMRKSLEIAMGDFKEFEVVTFKNAIDALKKLDDSFDLIITDINMPNMDGIQMCKEIRNISKNIPIIILSAYNDNEHFLETIKLGVDGYILKPIVMKQFIQTTSKVLHKLKLIDENKTQTFYKYRVDHGHLY